MESQCDYSMYFPAVPLPPRELLAAAERGGYRALPRRNHLYLGESVRFLLVLRGNSGNNGGNNSGNAERNTGSAGRNTGNTGNGERNTGNGGRSAGNGGRSAGNAERNTGSAERNTGNTDRSAGNTDRNTGNTERGTGNVEKNTGSADRSAGNVERNTGNMEKNTGNIERNTGNMDRGTGNVERNAGNTDRNTRNMERSAGNVEKNTGNIERNTGNVERDIGNAERNIGNTERGTGNAERNPGNSERNAGNSDRSTGNSEENPGICDKNLGIPDKTPGNSDPKNGNSDKTPGNSDKTPGNSDKTPGNCGGRTPWLQLASSLSALATVTSGDRARDGEENLETAGNLGHEAREESGELFRECRALLTHARGSAGAGLPVDDPIISSDEVIFPLTVNLDRLPPGTAKAKIVVTVWQRDTEPAELQEGTGTGQVTVPGPGQVTMTGTGTGTGGYLRLLQGRAPGQVFRQQHGAFKAQVSTLLTVLPPPRVRCRQVTVSGKYLTVLKVANGSSQDELSLWDVQILPNFNASYLPVMPDGSVLLVDDVCHHSGEVPVGAFCRVPSCPSAWPCPLSALEEQNFLFQLQAPERPPRDAKEGLEVPLVAVVRWSTPKLPFTSSIVTHYRLPSIRLERPRFVMTATCPSPVVALQRFTVTYTLLNDLQDFLAVRLVWTPESAAGRAQDSLLCHSPLTNLGFSRKGSARTCTVAFQALRAGLFELSQHMRLKLQFTASVAGAPPEARPLSRRSSPSSPALRELVAGLGRSQSFSHQQPARSHLMRSGSVMERRAITPPVGSPVGRPLYLPAGDKAVLALDKIAKRECKVLVVPPVQ